MPAPNDVAHFGPPKKRKIDNSLPKSMPVQPPPTPALPEETSQSEHEEDTECFCGRADSDFLTTQILSKNFKYGESSAEDLWIECDCDTPHWCHAHCVAKHLKLTASGLKKWYYKDTDASYVCARHSSHRHSRRRSR